uniref:Adrenomedullin 2 n=1 Tax=Crocodylus porosus TaxID=8502 RepID=A0A7M4E764_CROPO
LAAVPTAPLLSNPVPFLGLPRSLPPGPAARPRLSLGRCRPGTRGPSHDVQGFLPGGGCVLRGDGTGRGWRHAARFHHGQLMRVGCVLGTCQVQNLSHRLWQLMGQSGRQDSSPINPNSPHSYG